jgi:DNA sulfur modification protein DndE
MADRTAAVAKIQTSAEAEQAFKKLREATGLPFATLARLALARSLAEAPSLDVELYRDETGQEFNRYSLLGDSDLLFRSLIILAANKRMSEEEIVRRHVKAHVDHGASLLLNRLSEVGKGEELLADLAAGAGAGRASTAPGVPEGVGSCVSTVGDEIGTGTPVVCEFNNTKRAANPHLAIVGIPGTGKTQILLKVLADLISKRQAGLPSIVFLDYKGDVSANERFVKVSGAKVYRLPYDQLPINPFLLREYSRQEIKLSAEEKAESFSSYQRLGPVQRGNLSKAIESVYANRQNMEVSYPDFKELAEELAVLYEEEEIKHDTLFETVRKLSEFSLFWDHASPRPPADPLWRESLVVNLSPLPALKEIVAFLVIERLYREMAALPDAPIDQKTGVRQLRCILAIDEAHNYLPRRNVFLERLIREGRSKGFAVFLSSQSPNDYDQGDFNYAELLQFVLVLRCTAATARAVSELIRCPQQTARDLVPELANLEPFECVCNNLTQSARSYTRFRATPFYQSYGSAQ